MIDVEGIVSAAVRSILTAAGGENRDKPEARATNRGSDVRAAICGGDVVACVGWLLEKKGAAKPAQIDGVFGGGKVVEMRRKSGK